MSFLSLSYFAVIAFSLAIQQMQMPRLFKKLFWLFVSFIFVFSYCDHKHALMLLAFSLSGFIFIKISLQKKQNAQFQQVFGSFSLVFLLLLYLLLKGYLGVKSSLFGAVGLSYILFKVLQLLLQTRSDKISELSLLDYFLHLFFYPTLVSGPVQGFENFSKQLNLSLSEKNHGDFFIILCRILSGLVKLYFISLWFQDSAKMIESLYAQNAFAGTDKTEIILKLVLSSSSYLLQLYINFSGYMDIVIGSALLLNFKLPENFNEPLLATSFLDLWNRWHITVSFWFRDNVFNPTLKFLVSHLARKKRHLHVYLAVLSIFISFLVMGLWHGVGKQYIYYGIILGILAAIQQFFEYKKWKLKVPSHLKHFHFYFSRALTLCLFSVALLFIRYNLSLISGVWQSLNATGLFKLGALYILVWLGICLSHDFLKIMLIKLTALATLFLKRFPILKPLFISIFLYLLILFAVSQKNEISSEVLYKVF